jgi:hypothetical protein
LPLLECPSARFTGCSAFGLAKSETKQGWSLARKPMVVIGFSSAPSLALCLTHTLLPFVTEDLR